MSDAPADLLVLGTRVLAAQPFSGLVGARLVRLVPGEAEIEVEVRDDLRQQHGHVHGGVIAYLADNAITFAAGSVLGDAVTAQVSVSYVRPGGGETLRARARVVHAGRTLAIATCEVVAIEGGEERLVAVAQGTVARVGVPTEREAR